MNMNGLKIKPQQSLAKLDEETEDMSESILTSDLEENSNPSVRSSSSDEKRMNKNVSFDKIVGLNQDHQTSNSIVPKINMKSILKKITEQKGPPIKPKSSEEAIAERKVRMDKIALLQKQISLSQGNKQNTAKLIETFGHLSKNDRYQPPEQSDDEELEANEDLEIMMHQTGDETILDLTKMAERPDNVQQAYADYLKMKAYKIVRKSKATYKPRPITKARQEILANKNPDINQEFSSSVARVYNSIIDNEQQNLDRRVKKVKVVFDNNPLGCDLSKI